jgi:MOSC domain-containing protein YiiM
MSGDVADVVVEAIYLAGEAAAPPRPVARVRAIAGRGLDGDRYAAGVGTYSGRPGTGRHLTLIEAEAVEGLVLPDGARLDPADARRNLLTRGITLDTLLGRRFTVGEVECVGRRRCDPCAHLERLTHAGVLRGLTRRGGLRADILTDGDIAVGDAVRPVDG